MPRTGITLAPIGSLQKALFTSFFLFLLLDPISLFAREKFPSFDGESLTTMALSLSPADTMRRDTTLLMGEGNDNLRQLEAVVLEETARKRTLLKSVPAVVADASFLRRYLSGVWVASLAQLPGVRAMTIGNGFSKPVIRGLGFNRVAYVEGDTKQEGQQWGADHGLEVDAFEDAEVTVTKGSRSLLYGSDALGGVIVSALPLMPLEHGWHGEVSLLGATINGGFGGSLLLGYRHANNYFRLRYSEQHYGDLQVNTDSITYLTIHIPVYNKRMKNTAGFNRSMKASYEHRVGRYTGFYMASNVYEKVGFFPGAHGIPDLRRVIDDGNRYNTALPHSNVNHLKLYTRHSYTFGEKWLAAASGSFQENIRQEWSPFHTHYPKEVPPKEAPDKELEMRLQALSLRFEFTYYGLDKIKIKAVSDFSSRLQKVGGYGFLLPSYTFYNGGVGLVSEYTPSEKWHFEGGVRYDVGAIKAPESKADYLEKYLTDNGFPHEVILANRIRSYAIDRGFKSFSGSVGVSYLPAQGYLFKFSMGRGFRFPGINELASNGVHHGSFRHERGDAGLDPERSVQLNLSSAITLPMIDLSLDGFFNYFDNYIYATPTGEWSVLPHAGQVFEYRQNKALLTGGELSAKWHFAPQWEYQAAAEYVYTYNLDRQVPLPFSPPLRMTHTLCYRPERAELAFTYRYLGRADRIVPGEETTPPGHLFDLYASYSFAVAKTELSVALTVDNLFNAVYYDHLSFYRKIGLPESGRNYRIIVRLPF